MLWKELLCSVLWWLILLLWVEECRESGVKVRVLLSVFFFVHAYLGE